MYSEFLLNYIKMEDKVIFGKYKLLLYKLIYFFKIILFTLNWYEEIGNFFKYFFN